MVYVVYSLKQYEMGNCIFKKMIWDYTNVCGYKKVPDGMLFCWGIFYNGNMENPIITLIPQQLLT